tara:strand:- start:830 stop:1138 length:309 start_codon:yes stop_codon:yes gene_type:complete
MKSIIDGKRFDTETATRIAAVGSETISVTDFNYWEADLYRTPKGRWFLAGRGGPMTMFARPNGSRATSGAGIIPVSDTEAQEYLEDGGNLDALELWFAIEEA